MIAFSDGYKLMQDDIDRAIKAAVSAVVAHLPKEAHRVDVVKSVLKVASESVETMPIHFQCEDENV